MSLKIWKKCSIHLQKKLSPTEFSIWIHPLKAKIKNKILYLYVSNNFILDWINNKYIKYFKKILNKFNNHEIISLKLKVKNKKYNKYNIYNNNLKKNYKKNNTQKKNFNYNINYIKSYQYNKINKKYYFSNFIEGKSNQLAKYSSYKLAKNLEKSNNPLFLYGNTGLGKTHLLHAIGNYILKNKKYAKVIYINSECFVQNMVKSLKNKSIEEFKRYYRSVDVLLIDDIQFFSNKTRSQEELFHTFNALFDKKQKIILTSDRYPKNIHGIADRLKSRFSWGLTISINPPDIKTRIAILLYKASEKNINLPYNIAKFIANKIFSNVRELEGILNKIQIYTKFTKKNINIEIIQNLLKDLIIPQKKNITIKKIQKIVSEYFKIKISDILSKKRSRSISQPRQIAMTLIKKLTNHSLSEIGIAFGRKNHTTVLHAYKKIKNLIKKNKKIYNDILYISHKITS